MRLIQEKKETGHRFRKHYFHLTVTVIIPNSTAINQVFSTSKSMHETTSLTSTLDRGHWSQPLQNFSNTNIKFSYQVILGYSWTVANK